ncbi:MAG: nitroreductase family protein [Planctomycetes bacterium]|nr:nitroreductase family protein [Planctomycetota bacterium]
MAAPNVRDAIRGRRSTKRFRSDPIPEKILREIVEMTVAAPSSYNLQPWRIVLVADEKQRAALCAAAYGQSQIREAPVTFVFAVSLNDWERDLEPMLRQAVQQGSWPEEYAEETRRAAPAGQKALAAAGLLREYNIKDAMIAATHTCLAAESFGLATCFMNGWREEEVKKVIGAGERPDIAIALVLPLGYPLETAPSPGRFPISHNVFRDRLGQPLT